MVISVSNPYPQVYGDPRRASSFPIDDDDDFGDNEEFFPSVTATSDHNEDPVRMQFDHDIAEAKRLPQKAFTDPKEQNIERMAFVLARKSEWEKTTHNGQNFLHHLACDSNEREPFINLQWLMSRAISRLKDHIGVMDKNNRTPITAALYVGNAMFCFVVCKHQKPETLETFKLALLSECKGHGNEREVTCLHTALFAEFPNEEIREYIIKTMCSFVPEEMFTVTDMKGRTPLHLAVEYERCSKTQVRIVDELLHRGPKALEVEISAYSLQNMSVYQYHESSRNYIEIKKKLLEEEKRTTRAKAEEYDVNLWTVDSEGNPMKPGAIIWKGVTGSPHSRANAMEVSPGLIQRNSFQGFNIPQDSKPADTRQRSSPIVEGMRLVPTQNAVDMLHQKEEDKDRQQAAKMISERLKLLYLRTQKPDCVSRCLHLQGERGE